MPVRFRRSGPDPVPVPTVPVPHGSGPDQVLVPTVLVEIPVPPVPVLPVPDGGPVPVWSGPSRIMPRTETFGSWQALRTEQGGPSHSRFTYSTEAFSAIDIFINFAVYFKIQTNFTVAKVMI